MKVLKFGGTSVGSPEAVHALVTIAKNSGERIFVISAFSGITDSLLQAAKLASEGHEWQQLFQTVSERHHSMIAALLQSPYREEATTGTQTLLDEISSLLLGISLVQDLSPRTLDLAASYGERLSAGIVSRVLTQSGIEAEAVDARRLIITDDKFGAAHWLESETLPRVRSVFANFSRTAVVTGFIASTLDGITTTLGRGGSDFTAGILGACLGAEEIQIWTDVDGIMTADPKAVPDAFVIPEISYVEAMEMSHFGAKVLHPPTILPAMARDIPDHILNTFNPQTTGTRIVREAAPSRWPVRGIAAIPSISLLLLQGPGLPGVTGIAGRMFAALASAGVNVMLITQGSSELSICSAVLPQDAERGARALREEFRYEIGSGTIQAPAIEKDLSIVAVVGEMMKHRVGIAGRVFKALGRNGVNVTAIAQGSSELNISIVVSAQDRSKAMSAVHDAFFLAGMRTVNLFLVGTGLIGGTLLSQIDRQQQILREDHSIRINIVGIANSRTMLIGEHPVDVSRWRELLSRGEATNLDSFIARMKKLNMPSACFCDCTASDAPAAYYQGILESSISIVTPNKRANSGSLDRYRALVELSREKGDIYRYETTVGAGLPVIGPLQGLVASGDRILRIEAVLSGTISYIFNELGKGRLFSQLVAEAKEKGYTEPDPRDDLGAVDAARKTLILIREAGFSLNYGDISIEPLLPARFVEAPTIDEFMAMLSEIDTVYGARQKEATSHGAVLRYVSTITPTSATISLREFDSSSPFWNLSGTENMVVFTTERYCHNPLVVRGPGAGAEVTAGGVFADILKLAE